MPNIKRKPFTPAAEEEEDPADYDTHFVPPAGWTEADVDQYLQPLSPSAVDFAALRSQQQANEEILANEPTLVKVEDILDPHISLWDAIMREAQRRCIIEWEKHTPLYAASLGAQIASQFSLTSCGHAEYGDPPVHEQNKRCLRHGKAPILTSVDGGMIRDLRLHVMIVGPPGSGKGTLPLMFLDPGSGIVPQNLFPAKYLGKMTDAGLFGTVKENAKDPHNPKRSFGLAYKYCSGFIGAEEFNLVKGAAKAQNINMNLEDRLLVFLDRGVVETDLASGSYSYSSGATLWAGNQSDRLWFGSGESGLSRRVVCDYVHVTEALNSRLKDAARQRARIGSVGRVREHIGQRLRYVIDNFNVHDIRSTPEYESLLNEFGLGEQSDYWGTVHYEEHLLNKIAVGYNILRYWDPSMTVLPLRVDDALRAILLRQVGIRESLFASRSLIDFELIQRLTTHGTAGISREALLREMRRLGGYDPTKVERELDSAARSGRVMLRGTGWSQVVSLPEDAPL
jgi:hypothetical protein